MGIKPGTYKLTQPAGIGPANMQITLCTLKVTAPEGEKPGSGLWPVGRTGRTAVAGDVDGPGGQRRPVTLKVTPGPGAPAVTLSRNAELAAQMNETEPTPGTTGPPAGFEFVGFVSTPFADSGVQELTWALEAGIGLPPGAGGGSYGGPLKVTTIVGTRFVTPTRPASRPINCKEEKTGRRDLLRGPRSGG